MIRSEVIGPEAIITEEAKIQTIEAEAILKALVADEGFVRQDLFEQSLQRALLASEASASVDANAVVFAKLYYELLVYCQRLRESNQCYIEGVPVEVCTPLVTMLGNIARVDTLVNKDADGRSYVDVIKLLEDLRVDAGDGGIGQIIDSPLIESAVGLLPLLDRIDFVFDLKDCNGLRIFPIGKVIANAIGKILHNGKRIDIAEVRLIRLAVRLFKEPGDDEGVAQMLDELVEKCNLGFISFLQRGCFIIDTQDASSFKMNGSLVFWDADRREVLVRSEDASYYVENAIYAALTEDEFSIRHELDREGNAIGCYVAFKMRENNSPISVLDVVKHPDGVRRVLELVFDYGARNILIDHALIKSRGAIFPLNPWCVNDRMIVSAFGRSGRQYYGRDRIVEAYAAFCLLPAALMGSRPLNRVTFGLCARLLSECNIGVGDLMLGLLTDDSWYQEQVLTNWASSVDETGKRKVSHDSLCKVLELWREQTEYCADGRTFSAQKFEAIDFLPFQHSRMSLYSLLGSDCKDDEYLYVGAVDKDGSGNLVVVVSAGRTYATTMQSGLSATAPDAVLLDDLGDYREYLDDVRVGDDVYFLYSPSSEEGRVVHQRSAKMFEEIEKMQRGRYTMGVGVGLAVNDGQCDIALSCMRLFETELKEHMAGCVTEDPGFDAALFIRLLHNLIWSGVSDETIGCYFRVLEGHQMLAFSNVVNDKYFTCSDDGVLCVPKDKREADSVLRSLLDESRCHSTRLAKDAYCTELVKKADETGTQKYFVKGDASPIWAIILLTDNIMTGDSTCKMLAAHLEIDSSNKSVRGRMMRYRTDSGEEVSLRDIIDCNGATLGVHAYYASDQGLKRVDEYLGNLVDMDIEMMPASRMEPLNIVDDETIGLANNLWDWKPKHGTIKATSGSYAVIRKHNMPKAVLFPSEMTDDPSRFICMFVKKRELTF